MIGGKIQHSAETIKEFIPPLWKKLLKTKLRSVELLDASPDPILITDINAHIYYVNPTWEKLTGYTFEQVKGQNPRLLQSGKTPKNVYKNLWENLTQGKSFSSDEVINKKQNGEEYQVHATYFPITKNDKIVLYVQMFHDITLRKKLEAQKDAFIGIASHELKTPLTTLYAYIQILEKRLIQKNDKKDLYIISNIMRETKRIIGLIDDLLNVNRLESGKLQFEPEEFDLNRLIEQVVIDFQYITETHEIKKEGNIEGKVIGDKHRIEQVLVNFLTNAIKYSPNAKKIIIHLANKKKRAVIGVQDFGFGILKEDLPHIFKRFYRTRDKEEERIKGFGLGLYIVSEIIRKHRGKTWVESKKGEGSTFFFSLPLAT